MFQGYGRIIHNHNANRTVTVSVGLNVLWDCLLQPDLINIFHNRISKIYLPVHSWVLCYFHNTLTMAFYYFNKLKKSFCEFLIIYHTGKNIALLWICVLCIIILHCGHEIQLGVKGLHHVTTVSQTSFHVKIYFICVLCRHGDLTLQTGHCFEIS
jgi:hypothetical protein